MPNGKKSQYIPVAEIARWEAAIARGRDLVRRRKQIASTQAKLDRVLAQARALGVD